MLNIVLPCAGAGTRFRAAGFQLPKPLIDLKGKPMIERVLENLGMPCPVRRRPGARQVEPAPIRHILLVLAEHLNRYKSYFGDDLPQKLVAAGFAEPTIVPVPTLTEGQASTCLLAASHINNREPLLIANCDQLIDWTPYDFVTRAAADRLDGIILTYTSQHPNNSYVELAPNGLVLRTAEKAVISDLATCGLYFWTRGQHFVRAAHDMIKANDRVNGEFYVCPAFNYLIRRGGRVAIQHVTGHWPIGTPAELQEYLAAHP